MHFWVSITLFLCRLGLLLPNGVGRPLLLIYLKSDKRDEKRGEPFLVQTIGLRMLHGE